MSQTGPAQWFGNTSLITTRRLREERPSTLLLASSASSTSQRVRGVRVFQIVQAEYQPLKFKILVDTTVGVPGIIGHKVLDRYGTGVDWHSEVRTPRSSR